MPIHAEGLIAFSDADITGRYRVMPHIANSTWTFKFGFPLPAQLALAGKGLNVTITLSWLGAWPWHRRFSRRDDDHGGEIVLGHGLVRTCTRIEVLPERRAVK
jgi:hypothetical protein